MGLFSSGKKRILIIEDESQMAEGLHARLTVEGFDVIVARDGKEGVDKARIVKPDLILMDIMMPRMNGIDACSVLKSDEATAAIPVLVLTARQTLGDTDDAFGAGADDFLSKPFNSNRLIEKIRKLIDRSNNPPQP